MMKHIALAVLAAAALAGCNRDGPDRDRPPVSRNFAVGGFERLEVAVGCRGQRRFHFVVARDVHRVDPVHLVGDSLRVSRRP